MLKIWLPSYDLKDDIRTYNGQDYKSAKDEYYHEKWYYKKDDPEKTDIKYGVNESTARDNEARRLETMAYATSIDNKLGTALSVFSNKKSYNDIKADEEVVNALKDYYNDLAKYIASPEANSMRKNEILYIFGSSMGEITALTENEYNKILNYVSYMTWMCAETSKIDVAIKLEKDGQYITTEFKDVNLGLVIRPQTKLTLEKHITELKITPPGTGVSPVLDANIDIRELIDNTKYDVDSEIPIPIINGDINNIKTGLKAFKETRKGRGFWYLETDIEELIQGANLEVTCTYVVKNEGEEDYLSNNLVDAYKAAEGNMEQYNNVLITASNDVKKYEKGNTNSYGNYLGQWYYNGNTQGTLPAVARVEEITEAINNDLSFVPGESVTTKVDGNNNIVKTSKQAFEVSENNVDRIMLDEEENPKTVKINTVVKSNPSKFLAKTVDKKIDGSNYADADTPDISTTLKLIRTLATSGEGIDIPTYLAEITEYTTASGSKDIDSIPDNVGYVYSENEDTIVPEKDTFLGERMVITKPTGLNGLKALEIVGVSVTSLAILGVGIILKHFLLLNTSHYYFLHLTQYVLLFLLM